MRGIALASVAPNEPFHSVEGRVCTLQKFPRSLPVSSADCAAMPYFGVKVWNKAMARCVSLQARL